MALMAAQRDALLASKLIVLGLLAEFCCWRAHELTHGAPVRFDTILIWLLMVLLPLPILAGLAMLAVIALHHYRSARPPLR